METNFTFLISPADAGALEGQVSRALEKRVELASQRADAEALGAHGQAQQR